jgi:outer membrane protein assembly factor BamB
MLGRRGMAALALLVAGLLPVAAGCTSRTSTQVAGVDSAASTDTARRLTSATASQAAWPMLGHDAVHTGRSPYPAPGATHLKWSVHIGARWSQWALTTGPVVGADGTVYVADTQENRLCAVSPEGKIKWAYSATGSIQTVPSVGPEGTVYFGCSDLKRPSVPRLCALTPEGKLKWTYRMDSVFKCSLGPSPVIGPDGTIHVVSDNGKKGHRAHLYAVSPDGKLKWSFELRGSDGSDPAVDASGTVYVGDYVGRLYALNRRGKLKWVYDTKSRAMVGPPAIDASGTVYTGCQDGRLYAFSADGKRKWSRYLVVDADCSYPAFGADGTVYVASALGLFAFSPNGTLRWRYAISDLWQYSSPAIGYDGTIYIGSGSGYVPRGDAGLDEMRKGYLNALSPNGTLKWSHPLSSLAGTPPAIDASGTVYISSLDGTLHAFGSD